MTILLLVALAAAFPPAHADHPMDHQGMDGMAMNHDMAAGSLHEVGQAQFAAIAEAVRLLEADPHTDWAKVNIDALRAHLVDMDNVTTRAVVMSTPVENGARFSVTSEDPAVRASIERMARMHSAMANKDGVFRTTVTAAKQGVDVTVVGASPADAAKIRGLGFFGLLTEGAHHQMHHLSLARGEGMHH